MNFLDRIIAFFEKYIFGLLLILAGIGLILLSLSGTATSFWYYILGPALVAWGSYLIFSKSKS